MADRAETGIAGVMGDSQPPEGERWIWTLTPRLEVRQSVPSLTIWAVYAASIGIGLIVSAMLLWLVGVSPAAVATEVSAVVTGSQRAMAALLAQTAPLIIVGLAATFAFRANFWNIGLEGQMIVGGIFATWIAIADIGPEALRLPLMAGMALAGGMLCIAGPALLKLRLGVNEIISSLLLNYVCFYLLLHLLYGAWSDPVSSFPHSEQFEPAEQLPGLAWQNLSTAFPLAIILVLASWWLLSASRVGYLINFVGSNPTMARAVGVPVAGLSLAAALGSGAIAGLAGFGVAAGIEFRLTQEFHAGYLFSGVLIAFLARNHPIGVVIVAFFVAVLMLVGQGLQVFYQVPFAMVDLIQAILIICVAGSEFALKYRLHWRRPA